MDVFSDEEGSSQYPFHSFPESQCSSHLSSTTTSSPMNVTTNEFTHGQSLSAQYSQNTELSDRSERKVGVQCVYSDHYHTLLLTYSGEVYGWGYNYKGQVLFKGPELVKTKIKLLNDFVSVSAGHDHSLAISSEGKLYSWGSNSSCQINKSSRESLPTTLISIPCEIKEIHGGRNCSFALTQEGQVVKWGGFVSPYFITDLQNIVFISVHYDSFVAIDDTCELFFFNRYFYDVDKSKYITKIPVSKYFSLKAPFEGCFFFSGDFLFVINTNGEVWKFAKQGDVPFNNKPTKVPGLSNIVSISGYTGVCAARDSSGKVFVWGKLSRISVVYKDSDEPRCIEAFTNIEGISVGYDFLFAYNKNTVWAWGSNDQGQLGTGDLIDRPQPVKVFGSEILGSFHYPRQPLDRMFSGLIKLVYWEYLNYLQNLFGNHPYVKARFYTKCGISKRVAQFAKEVFNVHPVHNKLSLKNPRKFNLNDNICDLQLRLSTVFKAPKVINTRIKKLDVYYDEVDYDPQLLLFFPNVEVLKLSGRSRFGFSLKLAHLSSLKCLELDYGCYIEQLPTSLVKLVLHSDDTEVYNLSYLLHLRELVVLSLFISSDILGGELPLPQSIVRLELFVDSWRGFEVEKTFIIPFQLLNLRELIIHRNVPTNITEQNFPLLRVVEIIGLEEKSLLNSSLSPLKFIDQALIKSVKLIKQQCLVELSCFPWWIHYPSDRHLIDIFDI
ncbi:hypothetical protein P9112_007409 [Eukaryota sp. TZLM1-RC]